MFDATPTLALACDRSPDLSPVKPTIRTALSDRPHKRRLLQMYQWYTEGLRLIRPTPMQEAFLSCLLKQRVAEGSNRALKTTAGVIEVARAVTGQDPYDKFPRIGVGLIVALDWQPHISTVWQKLTVEGEFQVIPDENTGLPRAVRADPNDPTRLAPYDDAYREKWTDGAPLIPPRMIKRVNCESISPPTPRWALIEGSSGRWEIDFRSSRGTPVQSKHYNFVQFDEQLHNEQFYYEAMRGLVAINEPPKHTPRFWWTATSQVSNPQYFELCDKATKPGASVATFRFLIKDNPFITDIEKKAFHDSLPEDERASRYYGEHAIVAARIYPTFDMGPHGCEPFEIPPDWSRYMALDPGRQNYGTLFVAVPPNERHVYVYDGFVMKNAGALAWAGQVKNRQRDNKFEAFVIDQQAGFQRAMGDEDDQGVSHRFWDALQTVGVIPAQCCHAKWAGFFPGTNNVRAREEALKNWMSIRGAGPGAGTSILQIFRGTLPELEQQIRYACMKLDDPTKREKQKRDESFVEDLEYMAHFDPRYAPPQPVNAPIKQWSVLDDWEDQQNFERRRDRLYL